MRIGNSIRAFVHLERLSETTIEGVLKVKKINYSALYGNICRRSSHVTHKRANKLLTCSKEQKSSKMVGV